ncbi:hypothetical protein GGR13_000757 [Brevundimonas variabilis]|uniref:Uncharacterized protein n=1 Tax=Brevundimonas variabilis TaxID=74312 RepID=A0A7W9CGG9_9CAUL|nr:hypothetical protein [Brevundimonas variabilis]
MISKILMLSGRRLNAILLLVTIIILGMAGLGMLDSPHI